MIRFNFDNELGTLVAHKGGEYIYYKDFVLNSEYLRDFNFSLQSQCLELKQDLFYKETELTNVTDRLNRLLVKYNDIGLD